MPLLSLNKLINDFYIGKQKAADLMIGLFSLLYIRSYVFSIIILNALSWAFAYHVSSKSGKGDMFWLHYNVDSGVNLIGDVRQIYTMPLLGLMIFLLNFALVTVLYGNNRFLPHVLMASALLANIMLLIALDLVYLINFQ